MAYALALKSYYDLASGNGDVILILTLIISQMTVIGLSACLHPIIALCNVKNMSSADIGIDVIDDSGPCTSLKKIILGVHENCLLPIFSKDPLIAPMIPEVLTVSRPESGASIFASELKAAAALGLASQPSTFDARENK